MYFYMYVNICVGVMRFTSVIFRISFIKLILHSFVTSAFVG